jgi:fumarate reductase flavoprotein subunit
VTPPSGAPEVLDADLLVLGAGAAGCVGALRAADRGLRVVLVDPHWSRANTLAISGGLFPAAGSAAQHAAGVHDSPQAWLDDLHAFAGDSVNPRIAESVAVAMPQVVEFLVGPCGLPIAFLPDVPAPGHSVARFHSVRPASGRDLHDALRDAVRGRRWASGALRVLRDAPIDTVRGPAPGVVARIGPGVDAPGGVQVYARAVLLAGGGFGGNTAMVAEFIPSMAGALHGGPATNDGSTIALGRAWGAALGGMDGYQGQGHTHPGGATRLGMSLPSLGAILVNRDGCRFVREDIGPSSLAAFVLGQPGGVALEVFDAQAEAAMGNHSAYQEALAAGRVIAAGDAGALAAVCGVPADRLRAELDVAAACARGERTDPLGRRAFARPLAPPYRASWVTGALAHTQGGLLTDGDARVLDLARQPLEGVFAAGGCAAGLSGQGGDGYLPGNGLAQAFALAVRAADAVADSRAGAGS